MDTKLEIMLNKTREDPIAAKRAFQGNLCDFCRATTNVSMPDLEYVESLCGTCKMKLQMFAHVANSVGVTFIDISNMWHGEG